ncbi:MerR family transcriptional regulator [Arthrobacter sp. Hz1]
MFSEEDFDRLMVIKQMKSLEFSLEEMADILSLLATPDTSGMGGRLAGFLEGAVNQRAKMARNLAQADEFIQRLSVQS